MTDRNRKLIPLLAAGLIHGVGCNMAVGNPETGDAPASFLHSVQLRLTPYADSSTLMQLPGLTGPATP